MQMRCKGAWHQRRGRNREMERRRHQRMSNAKFIPSNFSPFSQRANSSPSTRDEISRNSAGHLKLIYSYSFVNSKMNFDPTKPQLNSRAWVMPDFLWLMPVGLCFIVVDVYRHREFTILQKKKDNQHIMHNTGRSMFAKALHYILKCFLQDPKICSLLP